jgi:hypothetical protein
MERLTGNYLRGKFSPFMSTITDFATQSDYSGRPLPFSKDKPPEGESKYTWGEYLLEQQAPIPIAEGVQDIVRAMKEKGMTDVEVKQILDGIYIATIAGGTGAKVGIAPAQTSEERKAQAPQKLREKTFRKNSDPNKLLKPETVTGYTDLMHKLNQFENIKSEVKKTIDKLDKPEDIQKYLKSKKLDKDYVFLYNNSSSINALKTIINSYKNKSLKDQKQTVKIIENNIQHLLNIHKKNQRLKTEDQESFELDEAAMELYENALNKQEEKKTKKEEVIDKLE